MSPSGRSARAGTPAGRTPPRWPTRSGPRSRRPAWAPRPRTPAGPLRRQRHLRQHRGVPRGARDRRRARRRRLAEARRDGRDRGPRRADRPRTPRRGVTVAPLGRPRPIVLVVLDGFGIGRDPAADAIAAAPMPTWRGLLARWPHSTLGASRRRCRPAARPDGQLRGRASQPRRGPPGAPGPARASMPPSPTARSSSARPCSRRAGAPSTGRGTPPPRQPDRAGRRPRQRPASRGPRRAGARGRGVARVRVHALLDGRDTPPRSALGFVADLERRLAAAHPDAAIATVGGRYYAMDRDGRWDRVERGYDAIVHAESAQRAATATAAIEAAYARGETDEFVAPTVIDGVGRRGPRRRPGHPRQLPGRPGAPADPRPRRRPGVRRVRPDLARRAARRRPACSSSR